MKSFEKLSGISRAFISLLLTLVSVLIFEFTGNWYLAPIAGFIGGVLSEAFVLTGFSLHSYW